MDLSLISTYEFVEKMYEVEKIDFPILHIDDILNQKSKKINQIQTYPKLLSYAATIPPGELNRNSIAKNIGLDYKTVQNYIEILVKAGMLALVSENKSGSNLLKSKEKNYWIPAHRSSFCSLSSSFAIGSLFSNNFYFNKNDFYDIPK